MKIKVSKKNPAVDSLCEPFVIGPRSTPNSRAPPPVGEPGASRGGNDGIPNAEGRVQSFFFIIFGETEEWNVDLII